jgi:hypothetical protein
VVFPKPHLEKLTAALNNDKLPATDRPRVHEAIRRYESWIYALEEVDAPKNEAVQRMVNLLNEYKLYIDVNLIFDSEEDFLYRQKGQLKLDNSIIEEFLPRLVRKAVEPQLEASLSIGPNQCFSAITFTSNLINPRLGGGPTIRTKAQDFTICKKLYLQTSYDPNFTETVTSETFLAYVAAECKTNLDKTMFQEASATAHDVKCAVAGAKYYLVCEWLDMTPLSTAATDIDEVLILRKAKRVNSNVRQMYATRQGRTRGRDRYYQYLRDNPFRPEVFLRFVDHINALLSNEDPQEQNTLEQGFF